MTALATNLLAAPGTNWTSFTHTNGVAYPPAAAGGGGGGSPIPPPLLAATPAGTTASTTASTTAGTVAKKKRLARPQLPPVPWDPAALSVASGGLAPLLAGNPQPTSGPSATTNATCGFYRVVRTGAHLIRLADYGNDPSRPVFTVELGFTAGELGPLVLVHDGGMVPETPQFDPPFTNPVFVVDTRLLTNGLHELRAASSLVLSQPTGDTVIGGETVDVRSPAYPLQVGNAISFPYWEPEFSSTLWVQARCAPDDVDFFVHYYDENDAYIGTMSGHTTNGVVLAAWNLVLPSGQPYTGASASVVVETRWAQNGVSQSATAPSPYSRYAPDAFPVFGQWVVGRQKAWDNLVNAGSLTLVMDTIADGLRLLNSTSPNINLQVYPSYDMGGPNTGCYAISGSLTNTAVATNDWLVLRAALSVPGDARNFVYLGHGDSYGLGGYGKHSRTGSGLGLTWEDIGRALNNGRWHQATNGVRQRYRFALVYGCSSSASPLPEALGIAPLTRDEKAGNYNTSGGPRPRAFVGFDSDIQVAGAIIGGYAVEPRHADFLQRFWGKWSAGKTLEDSIHQAITDPPQYDTASLGSLEKIIGYKDLKFLEGNWR